MEEKHGSNHGPTTDPKQSPSNSGGTLFKRGPISPESFASAPSQLILWWMNGLFWQGYKKRIEEDDLYEMLDRNKAGFLAEGLMEQWEQEQACAREKGRKPSLIRAVFWTFWRRYYTIPIGLELGGIYMIPPTKLVDYFFFFGLLPTSLLLHITINRYLSSQPAARVAAGKW